MSSGSHPKRAHTHTHLRMLGILVIDQVSGMNISYNLSYWARDLMKFKEVIARARASHPQSVLRNEYQSQPYA